MRAEIYFRFLMRAHALHIKSTWGELDPVEQKLLEFVAVASLEERVLQVKDLTSLHDLGSPAMLHARLHVMCEAGWLHLLSTDDARRKQVALGKAAWRSFDKFGDYILAAVKKPA